MSSDEQILDPCEGSVEEILDLLQTAVKFISLWANEGSPDFPRAVSRMEFAARVEGHLVFDGTGYNVDLRWAEIVAGLANSFTTYAYADLEATEPKSEIKVLGTTAAYDLACLIARQNTSVGYYTPECLLPFAAAKAQRPDRPKGQGRDVEAYILRDRLATWAVQRLVDAGVLPSKNPVEGRNPHQNKKLCACDLVAAILYPPRWSNANYGAVLAAWQAIRCPIPDDHISPRRSALFMARSVLRDIRDGGQTC